MTHLIRCRAHVSDVCLDGQPTAVQFGEDLPLSKETDGTFLKTLADGVMVGTIVCDACYSALLPWTPSGAGLDDELPAAIEHLRTQRQFVKQHENPAELVTEAKDALEFAEEGSPRWMSLRAALVLAEDEVKARANVG